MNRIRRFGSLLCCSAILTGFFPVLPVQASPDTAASAAGVFRDIPVYRKSMKDKETLSCLFFEDLPEIPYLSMEDYYHTFLDGTMTVTSLGNGVYRYTESEYGDTALVDAAADTLRTEDLASFVSTPVFKKQGCGCFMGGPDRLAKVEEVYYDKSSDPVTLDFSRYHIDLREQDGVLYLPLPTLSDLFSNPDMLTVVYRGGRIFYLSEYREVNGGDAIQEDTETADWSRTGIRDPATARFTYDELCFSIDTFYGDPCLHSSFTRDVVSLGLDQALACNDPETRRLLQSERAGEYLSGLNRLLNIRMNDAGHTGFVPDNYVIGNLSEDAKKELQNYSILPEQNQLYYIVKTTTLRQKKWLSGQTRTRLLGEENYYRQDGTMLIRLDEFRVDYDGWDLFYEGKQKMPEDSIGIIVQGIRQAKEAGDTRVVLDLTTNGGGDTVALETIFGMFTGKMVFNAYNTLGRQYLTQIIRTDRNFDGVIDDGDDAVDFSDMHFAVLTSGYSFSCGNILPSLMKDAGFMVLGEQSGGGACCLARKQTADGVVFSISAHFKFVNSRGESVDDGVPVDRSLLRTNDDGSLNYEDFYDLQRLGREMDAYYAANPEKISLEDRSVVPPDEMIFPSVDSIPGDVSSGSSERQEASQDGTAHHENNSMRWLLYAGGALLLTGVVLSVLLLIRVLCRRHRQ